MKFELIWGQQYLLSGKYRFEKYCSKGVPITNPIELFLAQSCFLKFDRKIERCFEKLRFFSVFTFF